VWHTKTHTQGTGLAIYFPPNRYSMDNDYLPFVNTDPAALSAWFGFLDDLYKAIVAVGNDQSEQLCCTCDGMTEHACRRYTPLVPVNISGTHELWCGVC
jgi:hypothetical protein